MIKKITVEKYMASDHEARFKMTPEDYRYLEGMAKFYYDHKVIPKPTVHSLAKFAMIKFALDWIKVEEYALKKRKERQNVMSLLNMGDKNNNYSPRSVIPQTRTPHYKIQPMQPAKH
jgi:hypothetical protein